MMKMRKHILYIAIGLLAAAAITTTLLALNGFVTLPFFGKPIEQPPAGELHPQQGLTPAEVERLIAELPEHPAEADAAASIPHGWPTAAFPPSSRPVWAIWKSWLRRSRR